MNAKTSVANKKVSLIKLGLSNADVNALFFNYNALARENNRLRRTQEQLLEGLTFGVEIECVNAASELIHERAAENNLSINYERYNHTDNTRYYKFVSDASLQGVNPIECVSPVLCGKKGFNSLENCCKTLNEAGCSVNKSTGLHVHIGGVTNPNQYINVFQNYKMLEDVIDTFMARSRRCDNSHWCKTLKDHDFSDCHTIHDVQDELRYDRYHRVNAEAYNRHQTIEFRQHAGTINYEKISMWVKFCIRLVVWSADNVLTEPINSINEIPFLTAKEKKFFTNRAEQLASVA